jgi:ankyrin repeat protein
MNDGGLHRAESAAEVERLVDLGVRVDQPGWMGATPLFRAAERGLLEVARALLDLGADVRAQRPDDGLTPLHFAATAEVAELLLEHEADRLACDGHGRTPLHFACQSGHLDVAELLICSGAAVDAPARDGMTPLLWAAQEGHNGIVRRLLTAGASVNRPDHAGRTALHRAAWRGHAAVVQQLLQGGADPFLRNRAGQTARHEAEQNRHAPVIELLLAAEGDATGKERALSAPIGSPPPLIKLRMIPGRSEAIAIAKDAVLSRWTLGERPVVAAALQTRHPWFTDLAIDPDGAGFVVTTPEAQLELRDGTDLRVIRRIECPSNGGRGLFAVDLSADGRWIAVANSWEQVHLLDRVTGAVVSTVEAGERTGCVRFDPASRRLASACSFQGGGHVRIDRIEAGRLVPETELPRSDCDTPGSRFVDTLVHLAFSPGGDALALFETSAIGHEARPTGWRGNVVLYDTSTWKERWQVSIDAAVTEDRRSLDEAGHPMGYFTEPCFLDDATLACGTTAGHVLFYRLTDGILLRRVQVDRTADVVSLAWEPQTGTLWAALGGESGKLTRVVLDDQQFDRPTKPD